MSFTTAVQIKPEIVEAARRRIVGKPHIPIVVATDVTATFHRKGRASVVVLQTTAGGDIVGIGSATASEVDYRALDEDTLNKLGLVRAIHRAWRDAYGIHEPARPARPQRGAETPTTSNQAFEAFADRGLDVLRDLNTTIGSLAFGLTNAVEAIERARTEKESQ